MSPYELWLNETDEQGNPLDPEILKAARELGPTFLGTGKEKSAANH
jgi:hypothetical protein